MERQFMEITIQCNDFSHFVLVGEFLLKNNDSTTAYSTNIGFSTILKRHNRELVIFLQPKQRYTRIIFCNY